jgi:hypothetical protein
VKAIIMPPGWKDAIVKIRKVLRVVEKNQGAAWDCELQGGRARCTLAHLSVLAFRVGREYIEADQLNRTI